MRFLDVARAAETVATTRGTHAKRQVVADALARADPESLPHAARFLSGSPFARVDERVLQLGWSAVSKAVLSLLPQVDETVWRACYRATGDTGDALALLVEAYPPKRASPQRTLFEAASGPFTVLEAADAYARLATAPAAAKARLLEDAWRRMESVEVRYFTKIITGGMRIGLGENLVEAALARAFGCEAAAVRHASMLSGDIGETAALAREGRLGEAVFRLFHPLGFMLASALDEDPPEDPAPYLIEDKFDGIRAQLHAAGGRAELYSRTLDTAAEFPEILEAARRLAHEVVLDGEVIAVRPDGSAAPFALLQRRLGRKNVPDALRRDAPVRFVAYDVLFLDGEPLHRKTLVERRAALDSLDLSGLLGVSPLREAATRDEAARLFDEARARGNEGLMFKRRDSTYDFGKRGQAWLKLKRAFATLDVVVTAAELGHGKRAGLLSDVTFAVQGPGGELLNVGKAFTGLTNEEIRQMTSILKSLTIDRYGGNVHIVRPQIVLEVAFDSVTRSKRHKSGFALRFPRIVRWRHDKPVREIDALERVRELWIASGGAEAMGMESEGATG